MNELLRSQGYVILRGVFSREDLSRIGALLDKGLDQVDATPDEWGVEVVPLVERVPGIERFLSAATLVERVSQTLGGPAKRLYSGARFTSLGSESFLPWHFHAELAGGEGDGRWDPERDGAPQGIQRVIVTVYVDGATAENGPLWIYPRKVGDPWAAPNLENTGPWPGQTEVLLNPGDVAVWDVATFHAASCFSGPRRIFGGIYERADGRLLS